LAGNLAKYSLIFLVERVAGRNGLTLPFTSFPAPFSISTPSIFDSFRFGLLNELSCASNNAFTSKLFAESFLDGDVAVLFAF
jgi:hypothetical protein